MKSALRLNGIFAEPYAPLPKMEYVGRVKYTSRLEVAVEVTVLAGVLVFTLMYCGDAAS